MTSFSTKVFIFEENRYFHLPPGDVNLCIPESQLKLNQKLEVTIFANNSYLLVQDRHIIVIGKETPMRVTIRTSWITSPEHVILTGLCNGILCSQKTRPRWSLSMLYSSAEHWDLSVEEMLKYTEGWNSSNIVISPDLLLLQPNGTMLLICISVVENQQFCSAFYIQMPFECKFCNLEAPSVIEAFQPISEKIVQTSLDSKSLGISNQSVFSALVPQIGDSLVPCIRSLPASSIFINKCFEKIELKQQAEVDIKEQLSSMTDGEDNILDKVVSAGNPNEISETVQIISSQLTRLLSDDIRQTDSIEFNNRRNKAAEGLSSQFFDPTPSLKNIDSRALDYDTDIDTPRA
ncbi:hypothetical protein ACTXT7_003917 [Hymenolepis weldensis]